MSASIVADGDTAPALDPTEHVFDFVGLVYSTTLAYFIEFGYFKD